MRWQAFPAVRPTCFVIVSCLIIHFIYWHRDRPNATVTFAYYFLEISLYRKWQRYSHVRTYCQKPFEIGCSFYAIILQVRQQFARLLGST